MQLVSTGRRKFGWWWLHCITLHCLSLRISGRAGRSIDAPTHLGHRNVGSQPHVKYQGIKFFEAFPCVFLHCLLFQAVYRRLSVCSSKQETPENDSQQRQKLLSHLSSQDNPYLCSNDVNPPKHHASSSSIPPISSRDRLPLFLYGLQHCKIVPSQLNSPFPPGRGGPELAPSGRLTVPAGSWGNGQGPQGSGGYSTYMVSHQNPRNVTTHSPDPKEPQHAQRGFTP